MIKVAISGACGRMGQEVVRTIFNDSKTEVVSVIDLKYEGENIGEITGIKDLNLTVKKDLKSALEETKPDILVDFTDPANVYNNAKICLNSGVSPVIGTTGLKDEQLEELKKLSEEKHLGCLIAPNFATGAVLMMMFAKTASKFFDNAEIIEYHHNQKKDAPSGTAIKTAQMMSKEKENFASGNIAETELITGSRGGNFDKNIHIHSIRMPGYVASQEVIFGSTGQTLKIRHDSIDRTCFMPGVLMAVQKTKNSFTDWKIYFKKRNKNNGKIQCSNIRRFRSRWQQNKKYP